MTSRKMNTIKENDADSVTPASYIENYSTLGMMERVQGIEPWYSAWKAAALPLSYTRVWQRYALPGGGLQPSPGA